MTSLTITDPGLPFETFMREALTEAARAATAGEVPVGAVLVLDGLVLARACNTREAEQNPLGHAELNVLTAAAERLRDWRLTGTTLYCTVEPCVMCAGALVHARVQTVVFGCRDPRWGGLRSLYRLGEDERLNHRLEVIEGVLEEECRSMIVDFFRAKRNKGKA